MEPLKRYEGNGRMSKAVVYNGTLYLAGQTARSAGSDIKSQMNEVLAKILLLLKTYGSDKDAILSAHIFLKDMALFSEMNTIWDSWVELGHEPVRACVRADMSHPDTLVEVVITAAIVNL